VQRMVVCGLVLAMVTSVAAQTAVQSAAKVVRIKGNARFTTGNNVWQPLRVGALLRAGTVIQTASEGSYVDLILGNEESTVPTAAAAAAPASPSSSTPAAGDQNIVRVFENSTLAIDKLTTMDTGADTVSETQLDLQRGRIFGNVKKMSAASKYEVKLPNGVAGIRGTIYTLSAVGVVQVLVGSVVIAYVGADGNVVTQVVMGGQQFDARTGQV